MARAMTERSSYRWTRSVISRRERLGLTVDAIIWDGEVHQLQDDVLVARVWRGRKRSR